MRIKYTSETAEFKVVRLRELAPVEVGDTPDKIADYWRANIATAQWYDPEKESMCVVFLNARRKIIGFNLVALGTIDTVTSANREVFKAAIVMGCVAVVLGHNHPSGDPTPSESDIKFTRKLIDAGKIIGIDVLDHIIMGTVSADRPRDFLSLRELGYFYS